jgi:hypothetical protein
MAKSVWALKEDHIILPLYGDETDDPKLWLFSLSTTLSSAKFIEVLVTLWAIWWVRRKLIHEDMFQSPLSTHAFITKYLDELAYAGSKGKRQLATPKQKPKGKVVSTSGRSSED